MVSNVSGRLDLNVRIPREDGQSQMPIGFGAYEVRILPYFARFRRGNRIIFFVFNGRQQTRINISGFESLGGSQ
jgi:hypothetical protein